MAATTNNHIFKLLDKFPLQCLDYIPKLSFYPKNSDSIIISTSWAGVFKYNLHNNNLENILEYVDIEPTQYVHDYGQFIDYTNDTLHIFGYDDLHIAIDLKTKTITNKQSVIFHGDAKCAQMQIANENQIHILSFYDHHHLKFDCRNEIITNINSNTDVLDNDKTYPKLLYVEATKQLMILGGDEFDDIYYCNITEPYEWKLMKNVKMP
eukprot:552199_1